MGGLSGHMMHPYDDYDMTINELLEFINTTAGILNVPMVEKIDGFGCHVLYYNNEWRLARSKSDLRAGGISRADLHKRFAHNPQAADLYDTILLSFGLHSGLADMKPRRFEDGYTYNCEVVDRNLNTIPYSKFHVFVHNVWKWDPDYDTHEVLEVKSNEFDWDNVFRNKVEIKFDHPFYHDQVVTSLSEDIRWMIGGTATTIRECYQQAFCKYLTSNHFEVTHETAPLYKQVYMRIMNDGKINLRDLRKKWKEAGLKDEDLAYLIDNGAEIARNIKADLRHYIEMFGCYILSNCRGYLNEYVDFNVVAVLKERLDFAMNQPDLSPKDEYNIARFEANQSKIFPLEGVVVNFHGKLYKLTGTFGAINQLISNVRG